MYVMLFAAAQNFIDIKNKVETEWQTHSIRHEFRMEILEYGLVKRAWGLGPIQCKLEKEVCGHCMKKHCFIYGYYRDYYDQSKKSVFLGSSYENAHERMNEVKAFL